MHPANTRQIGAVSHDDLRVPLDRSLAQPFYPFDVVGRQTVLLAPTWHYGEVFAHWGRDADLFERLLSHLQQRNVNVILRLHDSFRFDKPYRRFLDGLAARYPNVLLKFKDHHPDNFLDLQVADVLEAVRELSHTDYNGDRSERHAWGYGRLDNPASVLRAKGYAEAEANGWV